MVGGGVAVDDAQLTGLVAFVLVAPLLAGGTCALVE